MIAQGRGGKVILLGSARGELGMANYSAYSPSKGAVHLQDLKPYEAPGHSSSINTNTPGTIIVVAFHYIVLVGSQLSVGNDRFSSPTGEWDQRKK